MKKQLIYIIMLLFAATNTFGQDGQEVTRRNAQEQAAFEKSFPVNPAKITPGTGADTRVDPALTAISPVNWKPAPTAADDRKLPGETQVNRNQVPIQTVPVAGHAQPEGIQPLDKTVNRREMVGPNTQPEAPKSGAVTNYRNINGPNTQPEGEKPTR